MAIIGKYTPEVSLNSLTVCYLDNEEDHIEELKQIIPPDNFELFIGTTDPSEAIRLATNKEIDILICDFKMPERDGLHILTLCHKENPSLKLILYTGFSLSKDDIEICKKYGIRRVKKLDTGNLRLTISIIANELEDFRSSFEKIDVDILNLKEVKSNPQKSSKAAKKDKLIIPNSVDYQTLLRAIKNLAKDLIDEYKRTPDKTNVVLHLSNNERVTVEDMIKDLENVTPRGLDHILLWLEANYFIKNEMEKDTK